MTAQMCKRLFVIHHLIQGKRDLALQLYENSVKPQFGGINQSLDFFPHQLLGEWTAAGKLQFWISHLKLVSCLANSLKLKIFQYGIGLKHDHSADVE